MCIIARTASTNLDAIHRAQRYHAAGADVTIVDGLSSAARVASAIPGPKQLDLIRGGKTPNLSAERAKALGFKILLYSTPMLYVAARDDAGRGPAARDDIKVLESESGTFGKLQIMLEGQHRRVNPASEFAPREPQSCGGDAVSGIDTPPVPRALVTETPAKRPRAWHTKT